MSKLPAAAPSLFFMSSFCETGWINNKKEYSVYFFLLKNDTTAFSLISILGEKKGDFSVWSTASIPWNQGETEWPRLQEANTQIPEKTRVLWSRIIPITPVAQTHGKQRKKKKKSCLLLRHSWDRFIIQAKANFDKQLGAISLKLSGSSLSYSQSNQGVVGVRGGGGGLKVMKKCATNVPLRKKKKRPAGKKCFNYN